jgi:hypothetical protein
MDSKHYDEDLDQIIESESPDQINRMILEKFSKKSGPQKSVSFYQSIIRLYEKYPSTTTELIETMCDWGYWKDYFMILLYSTNDNLNNYIYELCVTQINEDYENYKNEFQISTLAKWMPRYGKSFDKKIRCVKEFCNRLYPSLDWNNEDERNSAQMKYRKLLSTLNKSLDTVEIHLCSKEYEKIDFNKIPSRCLYNNMNRFLKNDITRSKLQIHLYKKYVKYDFKEFMDKAIKTHSDFEKAILKEVWNINKYDFKDQIENLIGANLKSTDVVIDTSKSMYDDKLISVSFGIALMASMYENKVIINAYDPYVITFGEKFNLFDNLNKISNECAFYDKINFEKIFEKELMKRKTLFAITNKPYVVPENYNAKPKIIYWELTKDKEVFEYTEPCKNFFYSYGNFYKTTTVVAIKRKENNNKISKIISNSDELGMCDLDKMMMYGITGLISINVIALSIVLNY